MNHSVNNSNDRQSLSANTIQDWLIEQFAQQLGVETEEIDKRVPFDNYGLDSAQAMMIATEGEKLLGFLPAPTLFWHYPTIESLSERLAEEFTASESEILEI
jgi:acyl carrier protein